MNLIEVGVPAGVYRKGTELQSAGRWFDSHLVRWVEGVLQPIGGWVPLTGGEPLPGHFQVSGKARAAHAWRNNVNQPFLAIGTHTGLYIYTGIELHNITPIGLTPGREDSQSFSGYGVGAYGRGAYGVARATAGATAVATTWSLDNFGQILVAIHSDDGRLMNWMGDPAIKAVPVVATTGTLPIKNRFLLVTEERFLLLFGADGDPRSIKWSEKEDFTQWAIDATTSAGFLNVQTAGVLRAATRVRKQILVLTNTDAHVLDYVGYPAYYGLQRAATGCGVVGSQALVEADDIAYWMGAGNFYKFDGAVQILPCEVRDYVFGDINAQQLEKVQALRVTGMNEVKWFYPSASSMEPDRYVTHNYQMNIWYYGKLGRTAGEHRGVFPAPIYIAADGKLYNHEVGNDYTGAALPYLESGPVELGDGGKVWDLTRLVPDEKTQGQVQAYFRTRYWPTSPATTHGPYLLTQPTSVRISGRQITLRAESTGNHNWRAGKFRFEHVIRGSR